jgi:lipopolysaccharide transport system permease protein
MAVDVVIVHSPARTRLLPFVNPCAVWIDLWRHREIIGHFTGREIAGRYRGSFLGLLWSFITPLIMLSVYTFVYGMVFKSRWPGSQSLAGFAVLMFAGQLAFQVFGEPVGRSSALIIGTPNFVKRVVFPLQILPVAVMGATLYHVAIGLFMALVGTLVVFGSIPWTALLVPLSILPLAMFGLGCTWFFAATGVYLRDIGYVVTVALQVLFYLTPIFYPVDAIPKSYQGWMQLNPLTPMVELVRGQLILGQVGDPAAWAASLIVGLVAMAAGYAWFMVTKKGFSDVI